MFWLVNIATMRRVDAWVGTPLCYALTAIRKGLGLFSSQRPQRGSTEGPVERILFLKLAEQGSTVLAYPAIHRAVEKVGRENVYFLVFEENRSILDAMDVVPRENVIAIKATSVIGTMINSLAAIRRMRSMKFSVAIDLEFFARSTAIFTFLSGARARVGLHAFSGDSPYRGDLMTLRVPYNPHIHTAQLFRGQVEAIDHPPELFPAFDLVPEPLNQLPHGSLVSTEDERDQVRSILETVTGRRDPRIVLLNANCSDLMPLRKWDQPNYLKLAKRLIERDTELFIAFTGAPNEAPAVEELLTQIDSDRVVSMAGKTTMRQLLVLYELCEILITNDSGPAHFATMTPIDVITLFGPETPKLFKGLSSRSHILWAHTACSPCVNAYNNRVSKCHDNVCMQRISVDQVYNLAIRILDTRAHSGSEPTVVLPAAEPRTGAPTVPAQSPAVPSTQSPLRSPPQAQDDVLKSP